MRIEIEVRERTINHSWKTYNFRLAVSTWKDIDDGKHMRLNEMILIVQFSLQYLILLQLSNLNLGKHTVGRHSINNCEILKNKS